MSEITLLGDTSAGKSTYLAMFRQALLERDWSTRVDDTTDKVLRRYKRELHNGRYPAPTQIGDITELHFEFFKSRLLRRDARLSLVLRDVAGAELDPANEDRGLDIYEKHFTDVRGALLLIDATTHHNMQWRHAEYLESVLNKLKTIILIRRQKHLDGKVGFGGRSSILPVPSGTFYLSVCLTKCDQLRETSSDPPRQLQAIATPARLTATIGRHAHSVLEDFRRVPAVRARLFACSATGYVRVPETGDYQRNDGHCISQQTDTGLAEPAHIYPENIADPFLWLLENVWNDLYGGLDAKLSRMLDSLGADL